MPFYFKLTLFNTNQHNYTHSIMNKTIATLALFGAAGAAFAQDATSTAPAQPAPAASAPANDWASNLSIAGTFGYESTYMFRGALLGRQVVQSGVELGYAIGQGEIYAGVWGSMPATRNADFVNEFDYYLGYTHNIDDIVSVDAGFTYYSYSSGGIRQTREIYVGATADVLLSPSAYLYYDFDLEQTVLETSISYSLDLEQYTHVTGLSLENTAYLGFVNTRKTTAGHPDPANNIQSVSKNHYLYFGFASDIAYAISDNVSTSIGIRWVINNDGHNGNSVNNSGRKDNQFWVGGSVGFAY